MLSRLRNRAGSRLREPFGKAGLTVAVIALVFAMLGGAYAAGKLTSTQKKEVEKIAKGLQGSGPAGPQGPKGDKGDPGPKGDTGEKGAKGANGKGAEVTPFTGAMGPVNGVTCEEGGVEVRSASVATLVCNGKKGEGGTGGGGGFPKTLPSKASEAGRWAYGLTPNTQSQAYAPISFGIPLETIPTLHFVKTGKEVTGCGSALEPVADPGNLCVYEEAPAFTSRGAALFEPGTKPDTGTKGAPPLAGAVLVFNMEEEEFPLYKESANWGSWVVTAP